MRSTTRPPESPIARAQRLLLGDGHNPQPSPPRTSEPAAAPDARPPSTSPPGPNGKSNGRYAMGDILLLDGGGVIVYRQPVPGKPYDFTYQLVPDGRFEARAVTVASHGPRVLGRVNADLLRGLIRDKQWERETLIDCLSDASLAGLLPRDGADGGASAGAATAGADLGLTRGRRVIIKNGRHAWEAVYWGAGDDGDDVLAHKAGDVWHLTHMDLSQYGDKLEVGDPIDPTAISDILECVMASP